MGNVAGLNEEEKAQLEQQIARSKDAIESSLLKHFGRVDVVNCFVEPKSNKVRYRCIYLFLIFYLFIFNILFTLFIYCICSYYFCKYVK